MERIDAPRIAEAILAAPGWARVGITAPTACMREDAALELAESIAEALTSAPAEIQDEGQATLPL